VPDASATDWISDPSWDTVLVGSVFLPGVCTIENLEIGRDIDVQKRRKKEKARIRDNGLSPITFDILVEMTAADWAEWLRVLPYIQPKEGGTRTPLEIIHPMVNAYGVKDIYIHKIKSPAPSARRGYRVEIHVGEWFEEEKDADQNKGVKPAQRNHQTEAHPNSPGGQRSSSPLAGIATSGIDRNALRDALNAPPPAEDPKNISDNLFGG
jgi:hypothetical protein